MKVIARTLLMALSFGTFITQTSQAMETPDKEGIKGTPISLKENNEQVDLDKIIGQLLMVGFQRTLPEEDDPTQALQKHLDLTTGEIISRLKKDWKGDIHSCDKGHEHMLIFADILTDGIAKTIPR